MPVHVLVPILVLPILALRLRLRWLFSLLPIAYTSVYRYGIYYATNQSSLQRGPCIWDKDFCSCISSPYIGDPGIVAGAYGNIRVQHNSGPS